MNLPPAGASTIPAAEGAAGSLLEVRDLTVRFDTDAGTVHAANEVSFSIRRSEILGLIGETGSGKSTVAKSIVGLLPPAARVDAGAITLRLSHGEPRSLLGLSRGQLRKIRGAVVSFVPQSTTGALNPVVRIGQQFDDLIRSHRRVSRRWRRERAVAMLERTRIADPERVLRGFAHELSGGMAQRVALAMALTLDPDLIIADEPTTGLDLTVQRQILELMRALVKDAGTSMLLVTHDMGVVAQFCDRVLVMYSGFVLETGTVSDVFMRPAHPYTRGLLGAAPERGHPLRVIPGSSGSLLELPEGCPFAARCPVREDARCDSERPPMRLISGDHRAATFCKPRGAD